MWKRWRTGRYLLLVVLMAIMMNFVLPELRYPQEKLKSTGFQRDDIAAVPGEQVKRESAEDGQQAEDSTLQETQAGALENLDDSELSQEEPPPIRQQETEGEKDSIHISLDELLTMEHMSFGDKLTGLTLLYRFDEKERDSLIALAQGGITVAEMEDIDDILERKLGPKDLGKLYRMVDKYRQLYAERKLQQ